MKILHVYRTYFPDSQGGLEEAIRQLCAGTSALGVQNRIFTLSPDPSPAVLSREEAEVHRFRRDFEIASCSMSLRCLSGFRQLVAWADIVHYQFPWPFADLLHFAAAVRKPTLISYQADIVRQQGWLRLYQPLMHRFLAAAAAIVASTPNYAASSPVLPGYLHKLRIIPIGLDPGRYPPASEDQLAAVRHRYGQDYFLFVGVLRYYKGLHLLLEAARNAPFGLVIVGSGPMENALRQQAASLGLTNVRFTGFVDDGVKTALYAQARAVVFPSHLRSEAFGVTLLEGALFGKPLISAEIGSGMSYINQHLHTGLIVPANDPAALRQAMLQLHRDPALARKFGDNAYQRYCRLFTAQRMAGCYHKLYLDLLG